MSAINDDASLATSMAVKGYTAGAIVRPAVAHGLTSRGLEVFIGRTHRDPGGRG